MATPRYRFGDDVVSTISGQAGFIAGIAHYDASVIAGQLYRVLGDAGSFYAYEAHLQPRPTDDNANNLQRDSNASE